MNWNQFEVDGTQFAFAVAPDDCGMGPPWEEHCGHGEVREIRRNLWGHYPKAPGERIIWEDGRADVALAYDFAGACELAKRDGWGFLPGELKTERLESGAWRASVRGRGQHFEAVAEDVNEAVRAVYAAHRATFPSARAYAAAAAEADMDYCARWASGDSYWVTLAVAPVCPCCGEVDESRAAYLGGIESDSGDSYFEEKARELASEVDAGACT